MEGKGRNGPPYWFKGLTFVLKAHKQNYHP
jgi:hypothetical protein